MWQCRTLWKDICMHSTHQMAECKKQCDLTLTSYRSSTCSHWDVKVYAVLKNHYSLLQILRHLNQYIWLFLMFLEYLLAMFHAWSVCGLSWLSTNLFSFYRLSCLWPNRSTNHLYNIISQSLENLTTFKETWLIMLQQRLLAGNLSCLQEIKYWSISLVWFYQLWWTPC
jgi:hypothetical protein